MRSSPLALHTWSLDTTPLAEILSVARRTGWEGVELRRVDFTRAFDAGRAAPDVLELVRGSGLGVAAVGVEMGWMFATGAERERLVRVFDESCEWASALGCPTVMSPVDRGRGALDRAVASVREVAELAGRHRVRLALEFNSQAEQINSLARVREIVVRAGHAHCGLLLDTYHLVRSGAAVSDLDDLGPEEIAYVQFSDVPRQGLEPAKAIDRLPPGRGCVPFASIFQAIRSKGYRGYLSYEAPNPEAWARDPEEVAREALDATQAVLDALPSS